MKKNEKWAQIIFLIAYFIELGILLVDKSALINPIEGRLFQVTFVLFVICIIMTNYSNQEWLIIIIFGLIGAISYFSTQRNEIIRIVVFLAAAKSIPLRKLMVITFWTTCAGVFLLMFLSMIGIMGEVALTTDFGRGGIETRYCFGLGHPNALHCMIWSLVTLGIYLYFEKIKWYHYSVLFLGNIILYQLTLSRTGVIITTLTILLSVLFTYMKSFRENKLVYDLGKIILLLAFLFSVIAAAVGTNWIVFDFIDRYLTGRIHFSQIYGGTFSWSAFSDSQNLEYFDMGFMRLFYWYGVVPGILSFAVLWLMITNCFKRKDYRMYLVVMVFVIYTIVEAHAVSVYIPRNYIILLLSGCWTTFLGDSVREERDILGLVKFAFHR